VRSNVVVALGSALEVVGDIIIQSRLTGIGVIPALVIIGTSSELTLELEVLPPILVLFKEGTALILGPVLVLSVHALFAVGTVFIKAVIYILLNDLEVVCTKRERK
jgi:hypothetical protein